MSERNPDSGRWKSVAGKDHCYTTGLTMADLDALRPIINPEGGAAVAEPKWTYTDGLWMYGEGSTPEAARDDFLAKLTATYDSLYERIEAVQDQIRRARG